MQVPVQEHFDSLIASLEEEVAIRDREIDLLREISLAISSELHLDKIFQLIAERARILLHAETLLIPILDKECSQYTYRAGSGANVDEIVGESLPIDFGVCGWVWKHKRAWWRGMLNELTDEERNKWEKEAGTLILVPLVGKKHFLGGIAGINKIGEKEFTERDLILLEVFASQAAIAIENAMAFDEVERSRELSIQLENELRKVNRDLKRANQQLEYMALYDQLTHLPNATLFKDRLHQEIRRANKTGSALSVVMINLDRFKEVNDAYGHDIGDELIRQVGLRIMAEIGDIQTVSRLSGDEFAVILSDTDQQQSNLIAQKILLSLEPVFNLEDKSLHISGSIGIASHPEDGTTVSDLMRHVDVAMTSAKRNKSRINHYDESLSLSLDGSMALMIDLRRALEKRQFELYYQPQIDLVTRKVMGVEALSRWSHPDRGNVRPDIFIAMLEQAGLMHQFTQWVMETAFAQSKCWLDAGLDIRISVNVTVQDMLDPGFLERTRDLSARYETAANIILELTENVFLSDYQRVEEVMKELRNIGLEMSIDDFGTGHSSLSRLKRLPVSEIKIDRSFISHMDSDLDDEIIVQSTIDLARNLDLMVVAEGVENEAVLHKLARLGCDVAQGFFMAKPMPLDEVEMFIQANS